MQTNTTVEVGFELTTGDQPVFRLDDTVRGRLDNTTYRLAGAIFIDISDAVTSVSVKRGKSRDLDRYSAGQASITLNNENRYFDPLYASSPYVNNIIPRRAVRISTNSIVQFTGYVDDWNFDYDISGKSTAQIQAADAFTLLAQQNVLPGTATPQLTSDRVNAVLNMSTVAWPVIDRDIETGLQTVGADVFDGNALEYLQKVETSEQGSLFISKDGKVTFRPGDATATSAGNIVFADDGSGIPFTAAQVTYGTELLTNQVTVASSAGTATANNLTSQSSYGITATNISTLLSTGAANQNVADFIVAKYGEPEYRFEYIDIQLDGISGAYVEDVLNLDLGDIVQVVFTPNGVGSEITQHGQVISIEQRVGIDQHTVRLGLAGLLFSLLVLDDAEFGILDEDSLGM